MTGGQTRKKSVRKKTKKAAKKEPGGTLEGTRRLYDMAKSAARRCGDVKDTLAREKEAVAAIVLSVITLEAFINGIGKYAMDDSMEISRELKTLGHLLASDDNDRMPLAKKYECADVLLGGPPGDMGRQPFQDLKLLVGIRNAIIHSGPESVEFEVTGTSRAPVQPKPVQRLIAAKWIGDPLGPGARPLLSNVAVASVADRAVETVEKVIRHVLGTMPECWIKEMMSEPWKPRKVRTRK